MKIKRQLGESPGSATTGSASYMSYTACTMIGCFSLCTDTIPWRKKEHQVKPMNCLTTLNQMHSTRNKELTDRRRALLSNMLTGVGIATKILQYVNNIFCDVTQRIVEIPYRRFRTTYRSHPQLSSIQQRILEPRGWGLQLLAA